MSSQVVTGDAVVLDLRPARLPTRVLADGIDLTVCLTLSYFWGYVMNTTLGESRAFTRAVDNIGYLLISFCYPIATETVSRGRTLGAWVMGLRTVRDDGGTIRLRHSLLRWLGFWLVDYSPFTGFVAGVVSMAVHPGGKRVGDLMAGTNVVRVRPPRSPDALPEMDPALAEWASRLEMSRVTNDLWAAARYAMQRRAWLRKQYRVVMTRALAHQIAVRTSPPPPPGLPPEDFLVAVLAERRRRSLAKMYAKQAAATPQAAGL